jgi:hypothetical protein
MIKAFLVFVSPNLIFYPTLWQIHLLPDGHEDRGEVGLVAVVVWVVLDLVYRRSLEIGRAHV